MHPRLRHNRLRDVGCEVRLVCLVDRLEGAREAIEAINVPVTSLYTKADFPGMDAGHQDP